MITFDQQTKTHRVVKLAPAGESYMGAFVDREAAEDYLLSRLPRAALTQGD